MAAVAVWEAIDVDGDDPTQYHAGDPADLVAAAAELLEALMVRPAWHAGAACGEHPEVSFFPDRGQSLAPAQAVCGGCLVRRECLDYAMGLSPAPDGVWGGLSRRAREKLTRADQTAEKAS